MHLNNPLELRGFKRLQAIRAGLSLMALYILSKLVDIGSASWLPGLGIVLGIYFSGRCLSPWKKDTSRVANLAKLFGWGNYVAWFNIGLLILGLGLYAFGATSIGQTDPETASFNFYRLGNHYTTFTAVYFLSYATSLLFWHFSSFLTLEVIFAATSFATLLSGHRAYQIDSPKLISSLAWNNPIFASLGFSPQHIFIFLACLVSVCLGVYLYLAAQRVLFSGETYRLQETKTSKPLVGSIIIVLLGLLGVFSWFLNQSYSTQLSRASSGVGYGDEEGESPLGFHSAVGKTKQPAAVLRLETSYPENPQKPMLYLREGALSKFSGSEMVKASDAYDKDAPRLSSKMNWRSSTAQPSGERKAVKQSVFFLIEQDDPFAIDFPISIAPLKNPDDDRFKSAYQALSLAPVTPLVDLGFRSLGDASWDEQTWAHYLRAPGSLTVSIDEELETSASLGEDEHGEDLRYAQLARTITKGVVTPLAKAQQIVTWLSETSIYTRNPGRKTIDGEDPVAAYLFSDDKRGYCVHFAHSAVYLMRLVGIPARIGIGYLVDTSYAKDGHILIHTGDRHAWPEIYVSDEGWVQLDVTPEQVEGDEEIIPDESLLEDLMSKLDPVIDLVEPLETEDMRPVKSFEDSDFAPSWIFKYVLPALVLLLFLSKLVVRHAWRIIARDKLKAKLAWLSVESQLADVGLARGYGETRSEYVSRLESSSSLHLGELLSACERPVFIDSGEGESEPSPHEIKELMERFTGSLKGSIKPARRFLGFLRPVAFSRLVANG